MRNERKSLRGRGNEKEEVKRMREAKKEIKSKRMRDGREEVKRICE